MPTRGEVVVTLPGSSTTGSDSIIHEFEDLFYRNNCGRVSYHAGNVDNDVQIRFGYIVFGQGKILVDADYVTSLKNQGIKVDFKPPVSTGKIQF